MDVDKLCENFEIINFTNTYINRCKKFKDYNSLDEYVKDIIICLMDIFPYYDLEMSKEDVKVEIKDIEHSFNVDIPAYDYAIDLGYGCG